jgi:hypothetical protein
MATTIVTKSGSGAPTASDLVAGELAVDLTNKRLYTEDSGGTVLEVGSNPYNFTANHDGSAKLATTATGIDVTGAVTAGGLTVDGTTSVTQSSNAATALTSFTNSNAGTSSRTSISFTSDTGSSVVGTVSSTWNIDALNANETFLYGSHGVSLFAPASQNIRFLAGSSEKVRIDASGRVGIGTSSPDRLIDLRTAPAEDWQIRLGANNTDLDTYDIGRDAGDGLLHFYGNQTGYTGYVFDGIDGERMRIDGSGNVGINNSNPSAFDSLGGKYLVVGNGVNTSNLTLFSDDTADGNGYGHVAFADSAVSSSTAQYAGLIQYYHGEDSMRFYTNATEKMRIDGSGNLLVGTTDTTPYNNNANSTADNGIAAGAGLFAAARYQGSVGLFNRTGNDGEILGFKRSGAAVGSIGVANGDNLYIATDDTNDVGLKFNGDGNRITPCDASGADRGSAIDLGEAGGGLFKDLYLSGGMKLSRAVTSETEIESYNNTDSGGAKYKISFKQNGTQVGVIEVGTSTTGYLTSSDYRLKENVAPLTSATERLKQLNPSRFNFIADADKTVDGFLAHEVQDVVPEAISGTKDAMRDEEYEVTPAVLDDDGNVVTEAVMGTRSVPDYQGIDQSKLVPLLVATIQELEARIAALES